MLHEEARERGTLKSISGGPKLTAQTPTLKIFEISLRLYTSSRLFKKDM